MAFFVEKEFKSITKFITSPVEMGTKYLLRMAVQKENFDAKNMIW